MSTAEQAGLSGGYVVNTSGGAPWDEGKFLSPAPLPVPKVIASGFIGALFGIIVTILIMWLFIGKIVKAVEGNPWGFRSGYDAAIQRAVAPGQTARFLGEPSDNLKVTGFVDAGSKTKELWASREAFSGSREAPYFPNVTNRVLRTEDREKEAVRALGKINQERQRRGVGKGSEPLPWGPFWDEWKQTHPLEGEGGMTEGFKENRDLLPNY